MSAPLSNHQKAHLAQLARRAFNLESARARGRGETPPADFTAWRHEHVARACGRAGLRCCSQDNYKEVEAHFLDLLGQPARAFDAHVRGATNDRRIWEFKLLEACQQFGFHIAYADTICRRQNHGAGLDDVGTNILRNLFFTIRNRGLKKDRALSPKAPSSPPSSNPLSETLSETPHPHATPQA